MRGRNKLLEMMHGKPMIRHVVEAACNSKVDEIIVVLGWEVDKIRKVLADLPCRIAVNEDFEKGQSSSLITGLMQIGEDSQAVLVLPGDMARMDSLSINKVVDAYNMNNGLIVVACHNGIHGHPILLDKQLFREIMGITEDTYGLKAVVKRHETEIHLVETDTDNVLRDVDTPEDLYGLP
jgi:molybdenum cofactor cytidylyltransferase